MSAILSHTPGKLPPQHGTGSPRRAAERNPSANGASILHVGSPLATLVTHVLLIAVIAIAVSFVLLTLEQGVMDLVSRVRYLLVPRA